MPTFHYSAMYQDVNNSLHYTSGIVMNVSLTDLQKDGGYQKFTKKISEAMEPLPPNSNNIVVLSLSRIGD
jgi:hypothetical protein